MKLIIAGGRHFQSSEEDWRWTKSFLKKHKVTEVVSGKCPPDQWGRSADFFGELVAESMSIPVKPFPAQWTLYGKSAGFKRNKQMAEYADAVLLFPGGPGTADMREQAKEHGLRIYTR